MKCFSTGALVSLLFILLIAQHAGYAITGVGPQPSAAYLNHSKPTHRRVIVFINGIFGDSSTTWKNESTHEYWPELLAATEPFKSEADIYVFSFNSPILQSGQDIEQLAARLESYLHTDGVLEDHDQTIFICHSMGGLILRAFMLKERLPPKKVGFIYFFATPTQGSNVADVMQYLSPLSQIADMARIGNGHYLNDLHDHWLETSGDTKLNYPALVPSFCAAEGEKTLKLFFVVDRWSALDLCNRSPKDIAANHVDIVKPRDKDAEPFRFFEDAYLSIYPRTNRKSRVFGRSKPPQKTTTSIHLELRCDTTANSTLITKLDAKWGYKMVAAFAALQNPVNLMNSWAAVERLSGRKVTVAFSLSGQNGDAQKPCDRGAGDISVNGFSEWKPNWAQRLLSLFGLI
jgi:hypothetical protein